MSGSKKSFAALAIGLIIGISLIRWLGGWLWVPGLKLPTQWAENDNLPFIDSQLIISGKLGRYLWIRSLFNYKQNVYQVEKYIRYPERIIQDLGVDGVEVANDELRNIFYAEKPPYVFSGFFKTTWEGQDYQIAVQEWPGKLGSRFVFYIFDFRQLFPEKQKLLQQAFEGRFRILITPVLVFRDQGSCQKMVEGNEALCGLFLAENSGNDIIEKWLKNNRLPADSSCNFYWAVIRGIPDYRFYDKLFL
jgi:hypothetical protein